MIKYIKFILVAIFIIAIAVVTKNAIKFHIATKEFEEIELPVDADSTMWHDKEVYTLDDSIRNLWIKKGYKITDDYYDDDGSHITWFKHDSIK